MEISFINDEFSDNIDEAISFAKKNKLKYIELRKINGKNITDLTTDEIYSLSEKISSAGILVSAISSSFLNWKVDCDKFSINNQSVDSEVEYFNKLMDIADILGAPNICIYSYSKQDDIEITTLGEKLDTYSQLALERGITLLLEHKVNSNIDTINSLHKLFENYNFSNILPLLNLGDTIMSGDDFVIAELQDLISKCMYFHIKDYDCDLKRYVVLGEGNVDYENILSSKWNDNSTILSLTPSTGYQEDLQMSLNILQALEDE